MVDPDGLLAGLTKRVLESAPEVAMTEHLGYKTHQSSTSERDRNETRSETVLTKVCAPQIDIPRDGEWTSKPKIVHKQQRAGWTGSTRSPSG